MCPSTAPSALCGEEVGGQCLSHKSRVGPSQKGKGAPGVLQLSTPCHGQCVCHLGQAYPARHHSLCGCQADGSCVSSCRSGLELGRCPTLRWWASSDQWKALRPKLRFHREEESPPQDQSIGSCPRVSSLPFLLACPTDFRLGTPRTAEANSLK